MAAYDDQGDLDLAAQQAEATRLARQPDPAEYQSLMGDSDTAPAESLKGVGKMAAPVLGVGSAVVNAGQRLGILPGTPDEPTPDFSDVQGGSSSGPRPGSPEAPIDVGGVTPVPVAPEPVAAARRAVSGPRRATGGGPDVEPPIDLSGDLSSEHPYGSVLASQGVDPTVARYLAAQQAMKDQLTSAQEKAGAARNVALGLNTMEAGFGIGSDAVRQGRLAAAEAPVKDVLTQQEAAGRGLEQAGKEQEFFSKAEAANPSSAPNVAFRDFYKKAGINLPPGITLANGGQLAEKFLEHTDKQASEKRRIQVEREQKKADYERELMKEQHADYRAGLKDKGDRAEAKKNLTPEERKRMDEAFTGYDSVKDLEAEHAKTGVLSAAADVVGVPTDYSRAVSAQAGPVGQLEYPGARGPSAAKMATTALPTAKTPNPVAKKQFGQFKDVGLNRLEQYVQSQEAAHPDSPEVQMYRRKLDALKQEREQEKAAGGHPAGKRARDKNGVLREKGADGLWHPVG